MSDDLFPETIKLNLGKRAGYAMANRPLGYRGEKFSSTCFQRQLRDTYEDNKPRLGLDGAWMMEIPFKKAQRFIHNYEWLGTMGTTKFSLGLFVGDELVGVACFGLTAGTGALVEPFGAEYRDRGIVLVRGACAPFSHPHTGSYLIGQAKKELVRRGYLFTVAYSDPEAGEIGTLYQATNWKFYGFTSPVTYLVRPDGKRVDPKIIHKYAKKFGITSAEQKQNFIDEGYTFEKGSPKLKYLLPVGNKKEVRAMEKVRKVQYHPYLKRELGMENLYRLFQSGMVLPPEA
jgi:hypothetical protein